MTRLFELQLGLRHASDKKPGWDTPGKETPGYVAWLLWGDSGSGTGRAWVDRKAEAIKDGNGSSGKKDLPDNTVRQLSLDFVDGSCTNCSVDNVKVLSVAVHPSGRENFECLACFIEKTPWGHEYS